MTELEARMRVWRDGHAHPEGGEAPLVSPFQFSLQEDDGILERILA